MHTDHLAMRSVTRATLDLKAKIAMIVKKEGLR